MTTPPCKGCEFRREDCHSVCKAYLEFRAERDKMLEEKNARRDAGDFYSSVKKFTTDQSFKHRKWHGW